MGISLDKKQKAAPSARSIDELCINTVRTLSMDAVQQAESGHPGTPMALAPVVYTLWQRFLRFDPNQPIWPNRDRFVLSNGHASMLLYSMLHLAGVKEVNAAHVRRGELAVTLDDIKHFREIGSKCPGHPEYHLVVERGANDQSGPRKSERHCPRCVVPARFITSLLDVKQGKIVQVYRCDPCQKEIWKPRLTVAAE